MDNNNGQPDLSITDIRPVSGLYEDWFLDYASYVILERAVPNVYDGLKPVQRRILHAMREMDDGRFHKVANIIGQTMQYHPHGDASIGDALVNLGQKDLLVDAQGNWGDIRTGDSAAAARYIESRLSKLALDVLFNPKITEWQTSYDGRKREPVHLPAKIPLLLVQGVEGIAVGLSTKIMPHNFVEVLEASIDALRDKPFVLYPDFLTGGAVDVSHYNEGRKGSRLRVRARIESPDKKTLVIRSIPYGVTTGGLIDSIIKANDQGKIKIKKVVDNTAKDVELVIQLAPGVSPDITVDALYAFTDCEVSISPNACVIVDNKPQFMSVHEIVRVCARNTMAMLQRELEIRREELREKLLFSSLEKIFIEKRIYRRIEECETWEAVLQTIDKGLTPYKKQFYRALTQDDLLRLTEIRIKRISKFDAKKADELMRDLQAELEEVENNLAHLREYAINYYRQLIKKYGKGRERQTEIRTFDTITAQVVALSNQKLYVNRKEGFVGFGLKKDELIGECSDLDDIIVFRRDGKFSVVKVAEKVFVGKDILYAGVFRKGDERMVYNLVYLDGQSGWTYAKRFQVLGITREREYDLTKGTPGSKVIYLTANANAEAETVLVALSSATKARVKSFDFDFATLDIKGRSSQGNIITKYGVRKITLKEAGASTLGGIDIWYDPVIGRLNTEGRGQLLGNFDTENSVLVLYKDGSYELTSFDLTNRYEPDTIELMAQFDPAQVVAAVYFEGVQKRYFVKRFRIETSTLGKRFSFLPDTKGSRLVLATLEPQAQLEVSFRRDKKRSTPVEKTIYDLELLTEVKGWKAMGNRLSSYEVTQVKLLAAKSVGDVVKSVDEPTGSTRGGARRQLGMF